MDLTKRYLLANGPDDDDDGGGEGNPHGEGSPDGYPPIGGDDD